MNNDRQRALQHKIYVHKTKNMWKKTLGRKRKKVEAGKGVSTFFLPSFFFSIFFKNMFLRHSVYYYYYILVRPFYTHKKGTFLVTIFDF